MSEPAHAGGTATSAFDAPSRQCDLVMKGGITSGIVYPPLVIELAHTYRFRSIGGTSAGAIAAAVTAAAEFGRERGGFEKLQSLNTWLGSGTHLLELFQPTPATRPLLTLLLSLQRRGAPQSPRPGVGGWIAKGWALLPRWARLLFEVIPGALRDALPARFWIATVLGGLGGGAVDVVLARGLVSAGHPLARTIVAIVLPVMFVGCWLASTGACAWRLWRLLSVDVPRQGFGICTGTAPHASAGTPALTDWLHERIQDLAGLPADGRPLTVGDLGGKHGGGTGAEHGIELRMVTTSLSQGRSFVLPFEDESFLFREDEMRRLFPAAVVEHLVANAPPPDPARPVPHAYHRLPAATHMPVLVLARMSLSFPVVLSAVPLHLPAPHDGASAAHAHAHPQRVWFSDGGLTSNFPIHFFDAWLPARPTFGVNLTTAPRGHAAHRAGTVSLPAAGWSEEPPVEDIASLTGFLAAIWGTTQNFRDNTLASLPGYRERIVQVPLTSHEGGLNLAMGEQAVHRIMRKGDVAGGLLLAFDFDRHRWVRFLSFMAQFEPHALKLGEASRLAAYEQLLEGGAGDAFPYPRDAAWRTEALARLALLREYVGGLEARERLRVAASGSPPGASFFATDPPRPEGVLRMTPRN